MLQESPTERLTSTQAAMNSLIGPRAQRGMTTAMERAGAARNGRHGRYLPDAENRALEVRTGPEASTSRDPGPSQSQLCHSL